MRGEIVVFMPPVGFESPIGRDTHLIKRVVGLPGDTRETVRETIDFAKELNPDFAIFYAAIPYPGTQLAAMVEAKGGRLPAEWDDYRLMSAEAASSKKLAALNISELDEEDLRRFLKTAQMEFQLGRIGGGGAGAAVGLRNVLRVARLAASRARSPRDLLRYLGRVSADALLWLRGKLPGRRRP